MFLYEYHIALNVLREGRLEGALVNRALHALVSCDCVEHFGDAVCSPLLCICARNSVRCWYSQVCVPNATLSEPAATRIMYSIRCAATEHVLYKQYSVCDNVHRRRAHWWRASTMPTRQ